MLSILAGFIAGVIAVFIGTPLVWACGLAFIVAVVVFVIRVGVAAVGDDVGQTVWPLPAARLRPGSRRDVVHLGWSLRARKGRASADAVRRIRAVTVDTLVAHGISQNSETFDAAVDDLLGPRYAALIRPGAATVPSPHEIGIIIDRLEGFSTSDLDSRRRRQSGP